METKAALPASATQNSRALTRALASGALLLTGDPRGHVEAAQRQGGALRQQVQVAKEVYAFIGKANVFDAIDIPDAHDLADQRVDCNYGATIDPFRLDCTPSSEGVRIETLDSH